MHDYITFLVQFTYRIYTLYIDVFLKLLLWCMVFQSGTFNPMALNVTSWFRSVASHHQHVICNMLYINLIMGQENVKLLL